MMLKTMLTLVAAASMLFAFTALAMQIKINATKAKFSRRKLNTRHDACE